MPAKLALAIDAKCCSIAGFEMPRRLFLRPKRAVPCCKTWVRHLSCSVVGQRSPTLTPGRRAAWSSCQNGELRKQGLRLHLRSAREVIVSSRLSSVDDGPGEVEAWKGTRSWPWLVGHLFETAEGPYLLSDKPRTDLLANVLQTRGSEVFSSLPQSTHLCWHWILPCGTTFRLTLVLGPGGPPADHPLVSGDQR